MTLDTDFIVNWAHIPPTQTAIPAVSQSISPWHIARSGTFPDTMKIYTSQHSLASVMRYTCTHTHTDGNIEVIMLTDRGHQADCFDITGGGERLSDWVPDMLSWHRKAIQCHWLVMLNGCHADCLFVAEVVKGSHVDYLRCLKAIKQYHTGYCQFHNDNTISMA